MHAKTLNLFPLTLSTFLLAGCEIQTPMLDPLHWGPTKKEMKLYREEAKKREAEKVVRNAKIVELWKDGVSCLSISQQMEERMSERAVIVILEQAGFEVERKKYWPPSPFTFNDEELIKRQSRWYLNESLFTGVAVSKYKNGQKKTEVTFKEGLKQSQTEWFTNGKKFKERTYEYHKVRPYPKVRFKIYNKPSEVEGNHLKEEMVDEP